MGTENAENGKQRKKIETFDDILPYIGGAGRYQWLLFVLLLPFSIVYACLYFTQIFITLLPNEYWCRVPELDGWNLTERERIYFSIPNASANELAIDPTVPYSKCLVYDVNFTQYLIEKKTPDATWPVKPCQTWSFNYSTVPYASIAAELEWVCDKAYYSSVAQTLFFVGSIIGGFVFGYVADHHGRLPALIACNTVALLGSIATSFSNSFWSFCLCRLFVGTAFDNCFNILFIIVIEYVDPKRRTFMVNMSFGFYFAASTSLLPWIAYYVADWRLLSWITATPAVIVFAGPWIIPESARWYITNGKITQALKMLKKFERVNGMTVEKEIYDEFEQSCNETLKNDTSYSNDTVLSLFKKPRLAYLMVMLIIYWLLIIVVFDGSVWNMKLLHPDIFTSFSLAALTVLPSSIMLTLFLDKWGRRWMGFFSMLLCGVFSFIALATPTGSVTVAMGIIARFGVTIAASIGFQYVAEMLPTVARAQGVSLIHNIGYLAHMIGPYIVYLSEVSSSLPLTVLGLLSIIVAVQALSLPETLGQDLPQTLEDGNDFGREQNFWWVPCMSSSSEKKKKYQKRKISGT
ncbi:carcinine transporter-like [Athalia rosae]|uniref:carcinine transporter-like n=1 Tax=Athalia rosae TaxID=37344 RepID=UPI002033E8B4|nr:carcinine transporter-like [Athalia rosae]